MVNAIFHVIDEIHKPFLYVDKDPTSILDTF